MVVFLFKNEGGYFSLVGFEDCLFVIVIDYLGLIVMCYCLEKNILIFKI